MDLLSQYDSGDEDSSGSAIGDDRVSTTHEKNERFRRGNENGKRSITVALAGTTSSRKRKRGNVRILDQTDGRSNAVAITRRTHKIGSDINAKHDRRGDFASHTFRRRIPHIPGYWTGHIYIPVQLRRLPVEKADVSDDDDRESSSRCGSSVIQRRWTLRSRRGIRRWRRSLERSGSTGVVVQRPDGQLHVSLSRALRVPTASVESLVDRLRRRLQHVAAGTARIAASDHVLVSSPSDKVSSTTKQQRERSGGDVNVDDERPSSYHLVWDMVGENNCVRSCLSAVDAVLQQYNLPVFFKPPRFHVTVATFEGSKPPARDNDGDDEESRKRRNDRIPKSETTTRVSATAPAQNGSEDESVSSAGDSDCSSSSPSTCALESFVVPLTHIQCTFGTTKSYTIPLLASPDGAARR